VLRPTCRYLLCNKCLGCGTCADIENADLRLLLRSSGFRLIRPSAVPEVGVFQASRLEMIRLLRPMEINAPAGKLSDERRRPEMLISAALLEN